MNGGRDARTRIERVVRKGANRYLYLARNKVLFKSSTTPNKLQSSTCTKIGTEIHLTPPIVHLSRVFFPPAPYYRYRCYLFTKYRRSPAGLGEGCKKLGKLITRRHGPATNAAGWCPRAGLASKGKNFRTEFIKTILLHVRSCTGRNTPRVSVIPTSVFARRANRTIKPCGWRKYGKGYLFNFRIT